MDPARVEPARDALKMMEEMERGLTGDDSSLPMIPTYLSDDGAIPKDTSVVVIDAGGTNFRRALITFDDPGYRVEELSKWKMPGIERPATWEEFISFTADNIMPLLDRADKVGFCFSFSAEVTPEIDGRVQRIDKDTSGLLLVAKTEDAQVVLAKQFFDHTIERKYNALVWGDFDEDDGTIVGNLARSPKDRRIMAVCDEEHGKHAVTHWHVLERFGYVTLVECVLETGRTHQIRAHMKHIGHPLFSDASYGGDAILKGTTFSRYKQFVENCFEACPRQALHARILGFEHPRTGKHMHFESPLPDDMQALLERWRKYSTNKDLLA